MSVDESRSYQKDAAGFFAGVNNRQTLVLDGNLYLWCARLESS
jgi:hypothetical protein